MTNKMKLLAAAAVIVLPVAIAGAQTPLTATQSHPTRHASPPRPAPTPPAVQEPATPTANTATEDAQDATTTPATTPEPVNENAEPGTQAEVTTQAQTATPAPAQPQQLPPTPAPAPADAQAQAQTQTATPAAPDQPPTPAPAQTQVQAGATTVATAADLRAGIEVRDQAGGMVGTIESVDATGAVVATGTARAKLPLTSFGRNNQGLVISLTRAQLEAAAQQAQPTAS